MSRFLGLLADRAKQRAALNPYCGCHYSFHSYLYSYFTCLPTRLASAKPEARVVFQKLTSGTVTMGEIWTGMKVVFQCYLLYNIGWYTNRALCHIKEPMTNPHLKNIQLPVENPPSSSSSPAHH